MKNIIAIFYSPTILRKYFIQFKICKPIRPAQLSKHRQQRARVQLGNTHAGNEWIFNFKIQDFIARCFYIQWFIPT